eukprot:scaffold5.g613.t1
MTFLSRDHWAVASTLRPWVLDAASLLCLLAVTVCSGSVFTTSLGGVARMHGLVRDVALRWHGACVAALAALHAAGWAWAECQLRATKLGADDGRWFDLLFALYWAAHGTALCMLYRRGMAHLVVPLETLAWTAALLNALRLYSELQFLLHHMRCTTTDSIVRLALAGATALGTAVLALVQGRMAPDLSDDSLQEQLLQDGQAVALEARSRASLLGQRLAEGSERGAARLEALVRRGTRALSRAFGVE